MKREIKLPVTLEEAYETIEKYNIDVDSFAHSKVYDMDEFDEVCQCITPIELLQKTMFAEYINLYHPYFIFNNTGNIKTLTENEALEYLTDVTIDFCDSEGINYTKPS